MLREIRDYADDARTPDAVSSSVKLAQALTLPRVDIEVFDENSTMFHSFITLFDECVDKVTDNVQTKLTRLFQFTTGDAKEAIRSCVIVGGENGYLQARSILKKRFGNDHLVSTRLTQNLRNGRPVRSPIEIQKLADELVNAQMILLPMKQLHEVDTQCTIMDIVNRLPRYGHDKWVQRALDYRRKNSAYPGYNELVSFMMELAEDANNPVYGSALPPDVAARGHATQPINRSSTNNSSFNAVRRPPCVVCDRDHCVIYCRVFKNMPLQEKRRVVQVHHLCINCLYSGHDVDQCRSNIVCTANNCNARHNVLLHGDGVVANTSVAKAPHTYMPVVEVLINIDLKAYALLDSGSTTSFCSQRMVDKLALEGVSANLNLSTLNNDSKNLSQLVSVSLSSVGGEHSRDIACYAVNNIPASTPHIDVSQYPYLQDLTFPYDVQVDLLIGQDNVGLMVPFDVRHGHGNKPFASRTLYGWCLNGAVSTTKDSQISISNFVTSSIEKDLERPWSMDNEGLNRRTRDHVAVDLSPSTVPTIQSTESTAYAVAVLPAVSTAVRKVSDSSTVEPVVLPMVDGEEANMKDGACYMNVLNKVQAAVFDCPDWRRWLQEYLYVHERCLNWFKGVGMFQFKIWFQDVNEQIFRNTWREGLSPGC